MKTFQFHSPTEVVFGAGQELRVGGGSVIDSAKAMAVGLGREKIGGFMRLDREDVVKIYREANK